jgi:hypothetical protein
MTALNRNASGPAIARSALGLKMGLQVKVWLDRAVHAWSQRLIKAQLPADPKSGHDKAACS